MDDALFRNGGELGRAMAERDWTRTAVGAPEHWPAALRNMVRIVLTSRFSMWAAWGPELTTFYNDAYWRDTLQDKHPWALGRPAAEMWAEIWPDIGPRIESVLETGVATWDEDLLLFLEPSGYPEETYHTFSYSPLDGDDGRPEGMLCVVVETTERVLGARRTSTLRDLAAAVATTRTEDDVLAAVATELGRNTADLPFTVTYLIDDAGAARLGAASWIEPGAPAAPVVIGADDPEPAWPLARLRAGEHVEVGDLSAVRRAVLAWAKDAALSEDATEDLQLALGEAVANAVEHAYPGQPSGERAFALTRRPDGGVDGLVEDFGTWRPVPSDAGFRGRGILMVHRLAKDVRIEAPPGGGRRCASGSPTTTPAPTSQQRAGDARHGRRLPTAPRCAPTGRPSRWPASSTSHRSAPSAPSCSARSIRRAATSRSSCAG